MTRATVWGWGEDLELAGKNAQKYVNKRWSTTTRECSIGISGKDKDDIFFGIIVYLSEPKEVESIVDDIIDVGLAGKGKLYFLTVDLYDNIASENRTYRNDLSTLRESYKKREQYLLQKFRSHPKVKDLLNENSMLILFFPITIICELETKRVNKIIINAGNYDFQNILDSLHLLTSKAIEKGIATRILGYDLWGNVDDLEIDDLYVEKGKVYLWLGPPAVRH